LFFILCEEVACPLCRDYAVAGEAGGFAVSLEEGAVGHDEVEVYPGDAAGGAGGAFDERVGLDLI
jgi:hypothetical protein